MLETHLRTHTCGFLSDNMIGKTVTLCGWMEQRRDLGNLIFLMLRDRYGVIQVVCNPEDSKVVHAIAETVRSEWVLQIQGVVQKKEDQTGIEIKATHIEVLNRSETPPFEIKPGTDVKNQDLRMGYRYLDLRRSTMQKNMQIRHELVHEIRSYFYTQKFIDIETPILVKGTPEGSREYLVPSRIHPGSFYVLPQSPQQLKQLLMVGGIDRYFQIARCFRDEDLRGDRQPEFTQFEIEMSFCDQEDILNVIEGCFHTLNEKMNQESKNWEVSKKEWKKYLEDGKFKRITWKEALSRFGSDKPDIRFGLELNDVSDITADCGFGVFEGAESVFALHVSASLGGFSRKEIDELTVIAQQNGAKGLAWYRIGEESGAVGKNTTTAFQQSLKERLKAEAGDMVFFGAGRFLSAVEPLGAVRLLIGDRFNLRNPNEFAYLWVLDFPLFEEKEDGSLVSAHHPFTSPHKEDMEYLETDPKRVRSYAYDIVLNGVELGGGSIRIHDSALQKKMFEVLGMNEDEIEMKFGHMMKAFRYGCPPHGGGAMGLDRVVMMFCEETNIRDVIAFPKNLSAQDLMLGAPSPMPEAELYEQNIMVRLPQKD